VVLIDTRQARTTTAVLDSKRTRFRGGERAMVEYAQQAAGVVDALTEALTATVVDYQEVGRLLNAGQDLLRDKVRCSTDLIDACVRRVLAAGAVGAKLTGSGHGGCLFAAVPEDALSGVLQAVADLPVHAVALPTTEPHGLISSFSESVVGAALV
jgi:galactokinase